MNGQSGAPPMGGGAPGGRPGAPRSPMGNALGGRPGAPRSPMGNANAGHATGLGMDIMSDEDFWYGTELDIPYERSAVAHIHSEDIASFWTMALSEDPSSYWSWDLGAAAVEHYDEPELDLAVWFYGGVGG